MTDGHSRSLRRLAAAFAGGLVLALAGFLVSDQLRGTPPEGPSTSGDVGTVLSVESASVYDPFGGGQGGENARLAPLTIDGDVQSAWTSDSYRTAEDFAQAKPGIGLRFDLGTSREVESVVLDLIRGGLDVELYTADDPPDEVDGLLGWQPVTSVRDIPSQWPLRMPPAEGRYWLLWITDLSTAPDGSYQAAVAEVSFVGPQ